MTNASKATLFDLSNELLELEQLLLDLEGNADAQDAAIKAALMEEDSLLDGILNDHRTTQQKVLYKINNICSLIRFLENLRDQRKAHAEMVRERARISENHIKRLKAMLIWFMDEHKLNKIETLEYRVSHYEREQQLELLVEPEELPPEYVEVDVVTTTVYKPQFDKIKADFEAGNAKAKKVATLGEGTKVLRISKPKSKGGYKDEE